MNVHSRPSYDVDSWQHSHWGHESLIITTTDCCPLPVMQRPWNAFGRSTHSTCRQALHRHGQAVSCYAICAGRVMLCHMGRLCHSPLHAGRG